MPTRGPYGLGRIVKLASMALAVFIVWFQSVFLTTAQPGVTPEGIVSSFFLIVVVAGPVYLLGASLERKARRSEGAGRAARTDRAKTVARRRGSA